MPAPRDLQGSVVALVGASGGLGRAIDHALTAAGATVVRSNRSGSGALGPIDVIADIRDPGAGESIVATAIDRHGRLDGIVIAAGIVAFGDVADTADITVEELFLTNSMAPLWIAHHAHAALAESRGFLVNVSGMIADTPMPGMATYAASKAAAAAGLVALRKEWRRAKIDVLDARPPHTETGLASRPLAGVSPTMPDGLEPQTVGDRIVTAIAARETELAPDAFA